MIFFNICSKSSSFEFASSLCSDGSLANARNSSSSTCDVLGELNLESRFLSSKIKYFIGCK